MAARWLVTLAMFIITHPADASALRVERGATKTTTTTAALPWVGAPQLVDAAIRTADDQVYIKTRGELVALTADGRVRWSRPSSAHGGVAVTRTAVVDGWVDRVTHRFGIVSYDPVDGRELARTDLGPTGGWYDYDRVAVAPDGPDEVVVSTLFGVE